MRLIVTDEWGLIKHFHSTKREGERGCSWYLLCQKGPEYRVLLLSLLSLHSYQIPGE